MYVCNLTQNFQRFSTNNLQLISGIANPAYFSSVRLRDLKEKQNWLQRLFADMREIISLIFLPHVLCVIINSEGFRH